MYLNKDREYYFEGKVADGGGGYNFKMALLVKKTKHPSAIISGALDEKQQIKTISQYKPDIQVSRNFM